MLTDVYPSRKKSNNGDNDDDDNYDKDNYKGNENN